MPRKKKTANKMTDEELKKRIFPKKLLDELKNINQQVDNDYKSKSQKPSQ